MSCPRWRSTASRRRSFRGRSVCGYSSGRGGRFSGFAGLRPPRRQHDSGEQTAQSTDLHRLLVEGLFAEFRESAAIGHSGATVTTHSSDIAAAASLVREQLGACRPRLAIILGSGLGQLADRIRRAVNIPYADIPGFPSSTVVGHAGRLVAGTVDGCDVIALSGRFHLYEGHSASVAGLPVRVAHALGARTLFVSNAAGGIRSTLRPGDLMLIADHINLMWRNPLIGPVVEGDERFPDMSAPYDPELLAVLREVSLDAGIPVQEGVYAAVLGPSYETPAEVRMLRWMGADAVGMSTIPEVLTARALGMRVAGVSCITNHAAGMTGQPLSHEEVLEITDRVKDSFERLVRGFAAKM